MAKPQKIYRKLPGRTVVSLIGRSRLWLGADHLLLVTANGAMEHYKRFAFRDIQAFVIQPTKRYALWNWIYGVCTVLWLAFFVVMVAMTWHDPDRVGRVAAICFASIVCAILLALLFIHNLLGATCRLFVQTAAQTESLTPVKRVKTARKLLAILSSKIDAAQQPSLDASLTANSSLTANEHFKL